MLNRIKTSKRSEGFTIIEVMIVLAIAALILLIVLLAVPALQRSSRNTQRKNDASAIATAIANTITNNNGQIPSGFSQNGTSNLESCGTGGNASGAASSTVCTSVGDSAKLGYYTSNNVYATSATSSTAPVTPTASNTTAAGTGNVTENSVLVVLDEDCNGNAGGTYNPRTAAIFYSVESGGSDTLQCTEQ